MARYVPGELVKIAFADLIQVFHRYWEEHGPAKQSRMICKHCGGEGHKGYECTVLIVSSTRCFPQPSLTRPTQCLTCGARDDHSTRSCPISKECFNCGMKGHISAVSTDWFAMPTFYNYFPLFRIAPIAGVMGYEPRPDLLTANDVRQRCTKPTSVSSTGASHTCSAVHRNAQPGGECTCTYPTIPKQTSSHTGRREKE
jgi:hypothetical protein